MPDEVLSQPRTLIGVGPGLCGLPRIQLLETVWKSEWGRLMTYAPEHEKELFDRSIRR